MTFNIIEEYCPTIYFGVPTLYAAQLRALDDCPRDFSSIRFCVSAGEALPSNIFRRWEKITKTLILDEFGLFGRLSLFVAKEP